MRLINADELWNELEILYENNKGKVNWNDALMEIKTAPTIEPERKKEEWKEVYAESDDSNSWIEFQCPHCGNTFGIESGEYGWHYTDPIPWKACPMCGGLAYMRGEQE